MEQVGISLRIFERGPGLVWRSMEIYAETSDGLANPGVRGEQVPNMGTVSEPARGGNVSKGEGRSALTGWTSTTSCSSTPEGSSGERERWPQWGSGDIWVNEGASWRYAAGGSAPLATSPG